MNRSALPTRLKFSLARLLWTVTGVAWFVALFTAPHSAVLVLDGCLLVILALKTAGCDKWPGWPTVQLPYFVWVFLLAAAVFLTSLLFPGIEYGHP